MIHVRSGGTVTRSLPFGRGEEVPLRRLAVPATLILLAGCKVAANAEEFRWSVHAPASVHEESRLHFTVETHQGGAAVSGVPYVWKVLWVGVEGIRHQGRSFEQESIRVKGGPGTAAVIILAFDRGHHLTEVARASVRVVSGTPPAD